VSGAAAAAWGDPAQPTWGRLGTRTAAPGLVAGAGEAPDRDLGRLRRSPLHRPRRAIRFLKRSQRQGRART